PLRGVARARLLLRRLALLLAAAETSAGDGTHARNLRHATVRHGLHHLGGLLEALHEAIYLRHGRARTARDAQATRAVEELGVAALGGRHRLDDRLRSGQLRLVEVLELLLHAARAGQHAQQALHGAHLLQLLHLREEVLECEAVGRELLRNLLRLLLVEGLLRLLDEREDVTEVEDPARHALGVEGLELLEPLARAREDDGAARNRGDRQRRTTAGIAIE